MMKKLAISMAVAAAMGMTAADAATVSEYDEGVLVPRVIHNGDQDTTAVGLIARSKGTVYWTFFDVDSNHKTNGQFDVTANDMHTFVWSQEAGVGLDGVEGYLVFVLDTDGDVKLLNDTQNQLAGAAFQVKTGNNDVAFLPTMPLDINDFSNGSGGSGVANLTTMGSGSIVNLASGISLASADCGTDGMQKVPEPEKVKVDMRYFIDGQEGGNDTSIVVWSASFIKGTYTVNMFDDEQNRKSVNFELPNEELNVIDPETIVGRPADFTDGFIRWTVPCGWTDTTHDTGAEQNGLVTYSEISSQAFGAVQTIVNPFGTNATP